MSRPQRTQKFDYMSEALAEAALAAAAGEVPVGAVLVDAPSGAILARAHNRVERDADPTAHAELLAIRAAAADSGLKRLTQADLYVTRSEEHTSGIHTLMRISYAVFCLKNKT